MPAKKKKKVIFCVPFLKELTTPFIDALTASVPLVEAAGWDHGMVQEVGNVYISQARSNMLRKALNGEPDCVVFLDYDLSWDAGDLVKLIETEEDAVGGTYRFKEDDENYMGTPIIDENKRSPYKVGGLLAMSNLPAGFLKITVQGLSTFMKKYPELVYGQPVHPYLDLFNHGAMDGIWFGEDYAFSKRWRETGETLWCLPDLNIVHHDPAKAYPGNYHTFLQKLPGGLLDPARLKADAALDNPEVKALLESLTAGPLSMSTFGDNTLNGN